MKVATLLLLSVATLNAATTLQFSAGTGGLTDAANVIDRYIWGILVDTNRDGFVPLAYQYVADFVYPSTGTLQHVMSVRYAHLGNPGVPFATDDILILSSTPLFLSSGSNRATSLQVTYSGGIDAGDPYALIWFDATTVGTAALAETHFGILTGTAAVLQNDSGGVVAQSDFVNMPRSMNQQLLAVPEPSIMGFTLFGLSLAALRRKRCNKESTMVKSWKFC